MKQLLETLSDIMGAAFEEAGYDKKYGKVSLSNRPDLCEFQCNGAMAAAKEYKKAPFIIAGEVVEKLDNVTEISECVAVNPGFLNIKLSEEYLRSFLNAMKIARRFGLNAPKAKKIIIDYGGPNVAKPLHVGHLRSAIIGESVKRICRFMGNEVVGDIHLGDWGLQMGLIISELEVRKPDLVYFKPDADTIEEFPSDAPFTLSELEEIYPAASAKSKEDEAFKAKALEATFKLQNGYKPYRAIWNHIMTLSIADLKKNYANLNVDFDWWKGESDVQDIIPVMTKKMKDDGYAYESEGALVVDVKKDSDTKEVPPCMILKSDGAALYTTTDLATLDYRRKEYNPDKVIYVVDKRQEMHFEQVFRCAKKTGVVDDSTELDFIGFGTMNGKDGKPFKTREGGVMRLERLINDIREEMYNKIMENHESDPDEARATSEIVALAAIKYGDLSNQATKDYVFDIDKFTSFEGNTGPYILYTIVRIKSILKKYYENGGSNDCIVKAAVNPFEKALQLELTKFGPTISSAYEEIAPHKICAYIYDVSNSFNRFYHETKILTEEDEEKKSSWIALLTLTKDVLLQCIDLLGFDSPERM